MYKSIEAFPFEALCDRLQLGKLKEDPSSVTGGFLHRMYVLNTASGKYALKVLNPAIMARQEALGNFVRSERIAQEAAHTIPALPAKRWNGEALQRLDGRFFLLYEWQEGARLMPAEITEEHSACIGRLLAELHRTDFSGLDLAPAAPGPLQPTDWRMLGTQGDAAGAPWAPLLNSYLDSLFEWQDETLQAVEALTRGQRISHRDLDAKNVLWSGGRPVIVDWESAGYVHPMADMTETALYWAETEDGTIDGSRFLAFLGAYRQRGAAPSADWRTVLAAGYRGKLDWLAYSCRRSLGLEGADEQERQTGSSQVAHTLHALRRYADQLPALERWLCDAFR
ncbi:membrane protein [Paenibacillus sp. J31TS4]|uniref:phosphotransferase n=1 Tax=Paenibacillus sp. J31TS4 TaxID=2807195 RepID=UPI001B261F13|nr:phosphotransferase [Paenibacillus sp. J31TS4]GIP37364.1 membrane protein [Paenibacillus sp. J31TS4]